MPIQYTAVMFAIEFDCVFLCEVTEVKSENKRRSGGRQVSGVVHEPRSVTSDVQASVKLTMTSEAYM